MGPRIRQSVGRATVVATIAALGCVAVACGSLLGIDSGSPLADGGGPLDSDIPLDGNRGADSSLDGPFGSDGTPPDAASAPDGTSGSDGMSPDGIAPDGGLQGDAGCVPDINWCNTHCDVGPDNCHQTRTCPDDNCTTDERCVSNVCVCQSDPTWCNGRCLETKDNCGVSVMCPSMCDGGAACYNGVCGCMPDPPAKTCGSQQCGQATNNCSLAVNCGVGGTTACPTGDVCMANNQCCVPDNVAACGNQCGVAATNNCGQPVACPQACSNGGECVGNQCCIPRGCGGSCVDTCGQQNSACCMGMADASPPMDAGPPPFDGGSCLPPNAPCNGLAPCCGGSCSNSGTCVPMCGNSGGPCNTSSQCCYGLSCQSLNSSSSGSGSSGSSGSNGGSGSSGVAVPEGQPNLGPPILDGGVFLGICR